MSVAGIRALERMMKRKPGSLAKAVLYTVMSPDQIWSLDITGASRVAVQTPIRVKGEMLTEQGLVLGTYFFQPYIDLSITVQPGATTLRLRNRDVAQGSVSVRFEVIGGKA